MNPVHSLAAISILKYILFMFEKANPEKLILSKCENRRELE